MDPLFIVVLVLGAAMAAFAVVKTRRSGTFNGKVFAAQVGWVVGGLAVFVGFFAIVPFDPLLAMLLLVVAVYPAAGYFIGKAAERKDRSLWAFFWLTILATPVLMGIIVATLPPTGSPTSDASRFAPEVNAPAPSGVAGALKELAGLHESGAITDEEYRAAKAKVLAG